MAALADQAAGNVKFALDKRLLRLLPASSAVDVGPDNSGSRGLVTTRDVEEGEPLLVVPWQLSITVKSAAKRLAILEGKGIGLTTTPLERALALAAGEDPTLVPPGSGWALLLALQLLVRAALRSTGPAELRDPRSIFASYCATLPAPEGSRIAAVARGPAATDLLLFNQEELDELHCAGLAEAIGNERRRLVRLHEVLWGPPDSDPAVSFDSFLWAHCRVSSRAIGLIPIEDGDAKAECAAAADEAAAGSPAVLSSERAPAPPRVATRCMLPGVDLCNHSAWGRATASLSWLQSAGGDPANIVLVARRRLAAGESVTLDYGQRWMRKWLQDYGFVPEDCAKEMFEEVGAPLEAVLVDAHDAASTSGLVLHEVRLLETGLGATACHLVRDGFERAQGGRLEATVDEPGPEMWATFSGGHSVRVAQVHESSRRGHGYRDGLGPEADDGTGGGGGDGGERGFGYFGEMERGSGGDECCDPASAAPVDEDDERTDGENPSGAERTPPEVAEGSPLRVALLDADREADLAAAVAEKCLVVLEAFPTSAEEDERLLAELDARLAAGGGASLSTGGSSSAPGGAIIMVGGGGQSGVVLRGAAEHRRRALGFRLARKRLLAAAVEGLQAQAALLRFAAPPDRC